MHWELNGLTETNLGCNSGGNIFREMRFTPDNNKSETKIQRLSSIFVFQEKKISKNSNLGPFWVPFVKNWSNQSFRKKLGSARFPGLWSKTCTGSTDRVQD